MIILGIAPGYAIVGFGVVEYNANRFRVVEYGAVTTEACFKFTSRLNDIYDNLCKIIERTKPDALSIEKLFFLCYHWANT